MRRSRLPVLFPSLARLYGPFLSRNTQGSAKRLLGGLLAKTGLDQKSTIRSGGSVTPTRSMNYNSQSYSSTPPRMPLVQSGGWSVLPRAGVSTARACKRRGKGVQGSENMLFRYLLANSRSWRNVWLTIEVKKKMGGGKNWNKYIHPNSRAPRPDDPTGSFKGAC